jgi:hypothetical protein|tara:strand:- start:31 stop:204 length:174 start_codon:yes stop_codon:yes gene_type:complete
METKYDPKTYIDLAYETGQLVALLEQRNVLQEAINKQEDKVNKMKKQKDQEETFTDF